MADYGPVLSKPAEIIQGKGQGATAAAMGMLTAGETSQQLMLEGPGADGAAPGEQTQHCRHIGPRRAACLFWASIVVTGAHCRLLARDCGQGCCIRAA